MMSTFPPLEVVILSDFAHNNGGASAVALSSARRLAEVGCGVTLFSAVGPVADELKGMPGLETVCLGQRDIANNPRRLQAFASGIWNGEAADALRELLRGKNPANTVVHAHLWMKALSPAALGAVVDAGFKLTVTLHDFFIACPNGGFYEYPREKLCHRKPLSLSCLSCQCDRRSYVQKLWRYTRGMVQNRWLKIHQRVSHFIGVSNLGLEILRPSLPGETPKTVVRNPIECADRGPARVAGNDAFVFIGRLVPEKGPRLFAEAARRVGAQAVFVGDGELRAELERDFPEAKFTGWLPREAVTAAMRSARALVFPSLWYETLGLVVVEAMANGVPAIVSDQCAASEYVENGSRGLHFTHGSLDSLCEQMAALRDAAAAARLGQAAYDWYWANPWTVEAHVDDLLAVYRQMLFSKA